MTDETVGRRAIFVSHASGDGPWAEWIAWQLRQAGYAVELDIWDWPAGADFVTRMGDALARAAQVVAVCSPSYFSGPFASVELRAAFARGVREEGRVMPILVEHCEIPELYSRLIYIDLI